MDCSTPFPAWAKAVYGLGLLFWFYGLSLGDLSLAHFSTRYIYIYDSCFPSHLEGQLTPQVYQAFQTPADSSIRIPHLSTWHCWPYISSLQNPRTILAYYPFLRIHRWCIRMSCRLHIHELCPHLFFSLSSATNLCQIILLPPFSVMAVFIFQLSPSWGVPKS